VVLPSFAFVSSGGAPGVLTLRRFNPVYGWSRGANTAADAFSDISAWPGPHVVPACSRPHPDWFSSGRSTAESIQVGRSRDLRASTSGLRLPSAVRPV